VGCLVAPARDLTHHRPPERLAPRPNMDARRRSIDHPCRLLPPDDLSNPLRSAHRVKTENDKSAISTHASKVNAKDKPSIRSMLSLLVRRTGTARLTE
jgi:hypothetical protein